MANKAVIEFFKKAQSDIELTVKLEAAAQRQQIVNLARENGFEFTLEQLEEGLKVTQELMTVMETDMNLSDGDLESVSGGTSEEWQKLLQYNSNKRNDAFDIMTNFIKKMQDSRSSILRNMR